MRPGILLAALALDLLLGDPDGPLHPVRLMGALIARAEAWARRDSRRLRLRGAGLALLVVGATWLAGRAILEGALWLDGQLDSPGWCAFTAQALMVWSCLGLRSMREHALAVVVAVESRDLGAARAAAARIVGRDTEQLDEAGVCRACVESTAESLGDGVLGPLFFAALGGGPLALAYRAANTLDSLLGHKDERHRELGWASARLDDLLSWLPARKAALAAVACAKPLGLDAAGAWRVARRDARKQPSPNSGWPEGAFAGALGVRLGGPLSYRGERVEKAWLGEGGRTLDAALCRRALQLFTAAAVLAVAAYELSALLAPYLQHPSGSL